MKEPKERLSIQLKFRVTEEFKNTIEEYCKRYEISVSDFLRAAVNKELARKEVK